MKGLTPEEQEEYTRVLKQGNRILKCILIFALIMGCVYYFNKYICHV